MSDKRKWGWRKILTAIFALAFLLLHKYIDSKFWELEFIDTSPIGITICVVWTTLGAAATAKNLYYFPIFAVVTMCGIGIYEVFASDVVIYSSISRELVTIALLKRDVIMGMTYFLWYPIIYLNEDEDEGNS